MAKPRVTYEITAEDKTKRGIEAATRRLDKLKSVFAGIAVGASAAAGVGVFTAQIAASVDEVNKLSDRLGVTTEGLTALQFAASQTSVSTQALNVGLQRLTRRVSEAANGTGEAVNALKELGVDARRLNQLRPEQQFEVLADAFQNVNSQADRVRLAFKLFDTEGVALLQTMKGGADALRDYAAQAQNAGLILEQGVADQATAVTDAVDLMNQQFKAGGRELIRIFGPAVIEVSQALGSGFVRAAQEASRAVVALRAGFTGAAAGIASFLGFEDAAANLADLSNVYQQEFNDISDTINGYRSNLEALVDTQGVYNEGLKEITQNEDAAKEAKKRYNAEISEAKALFDQTRTALEKNSISVARYKELLDAGRISWETFTRAVEQADIALLDATGGLDAQNDKLRELASIQSEAKALFDQTRTAVERNSIAIARYRELLDQGAISWEVFTRAVEQADIALFEATGNITESVDEATKKTQDLLRDIKSEVDQFSNSLVDSMLDANKKIGDIVEDILTSFAKLAFRKAVADPISDSVGGFLGSLFGRASGGPVFKNDPVMVGERGPEVFVPQSNGNIVSNDALGGSGAVINFTVNSLDPRSAADVIIQNRNVIVGIVREGFNRTGNNPALA